MEIKVFFQENKVKKNMESLEDFWVPDDKVRNSKLQLHCHLKATLFMQASQQEHKVKAPILKAVPLAP